MHMWVPKINPAWQILMGDLFSGVISFQFLSKQIAATAIAFTTKKYTQLEELLSRYTTHNIDSTVLRD